MVKFNEKAFEAIDQEEQDMILSLENEKWQQVENVEEEKEKALMAAKNTIKKDKRINLRLTQKDYYQIQLKAIEEGIPYQTLISSVIHKYLNGAFVQR